MMFDRVKSKTPTTVLKRARHFVVVALACFIALGASVRAELPNPARTRHFASNGNSSAVGQFSPAAAGFDLADVSNRQELARLPDGVMGLMWIGECSGVTAHFQDLVNSVVDHPKLFGFYLMDDPDPTGRWRPLCKGSDLRAESDWIHERKPDALTFILLMNLGSSAAPAFSAEYAPDSSHVDLFGVSPYPCRIAWPTCDLNMIDRFVAAAQQSGIPLPRITPTYQAFGGGTWSSDGGDGYRMPTVAEMNSMLERWSELVPNPVFDYAYSWGVQRSDTALANSAQLQKVFLRHNRCGQEAATCP
ncbi:MAG: hypothetical protein JOZ30_01945 [Hyphomicrobiales bacterium]|nr:hypothetical protein [Hyphomicrobiales bacterium]